MVSARKPKVLKIILIFIAVIVLVLVGLVFAASRLFNRNDSASDNPAARARGAEMIKNSKVIIVVGAHPDDLEYYTGGTLGTLAGEGKTVVGVLTADLSDIQKIRRTEAVKAAKTLGYIPVFLGHPERDYNGGLTDADKQEIRSEVKALINKYDADTLITYDSYDQAPIYHHVDHIVTGIEAQAAAEETGLENVYLYSSGHPNTRVDISSATAKKTEAISFHESQQNRRWIRLVRILFGWTRPGGDENEQRFFGNSESFRKI